MNETTIDLWYRALVHDSYPSVSKEMWLSLRQNTKIGLSEMSFLKTNKMLLEELLQNHDMFAQQFYDDNAEQIRNHPSIRSKVYPYVAQYGYNRDDVVLWLVYAAHREIFNKTNRDAREVRYLPRAEQAREETKERIVELGELFLLARKYLKEKQKNLTQRERVVKAVELAESWSSFDSIPPDEEVDDSNAVNLEKLLVKLWRVRCHDLIKNLMDKESKHDKLQERLVEKRVEPKWLTSSSSMSIEKIVEKHEQTNVKSQMVFFVTRDDVDNTIIEGKIGRLLEQENAEEQDIDEEKELSEQEIADKLGLSRTEVRRRWEQFLERYKILFKIYYKDLLYFPDMAVLEDASILKSTIEDELKRSTLSSYEVETLSAFWLALKTLAEIINGQTEKTAKGVINDWKSIRNKLSNPEAKQYQLELRRKLSFVWAKSHEFW